MPVNEHVYCVAITFKMTEQVEQWIYIKFCVKLEHSSMETIWLIQKATTMSNWWLAYSLQQCTLSCITSHAEFFGETSNHPGDSAPLNPQLDALRLLAFLNCSSTVVSIFPSPLFPIHPLPYPTLNPSSLWLCPWVLYAHSLMTLTLLSPVTSLPPPLWLLSVCSLFPCLWLYFACLFVLLIRFHL